MPNPSASRDDRVPLRRRAAMLAVAAALAVGGVATVPSTARATPVGGGGLEPVGTITLLNADGTPAKPNQIRPIGIDGALGALVILGVGGKSAYLVGTETLRQQRVFPVTRPAEVVNGAVLDDVTHRLYVSPASDCAFGSTKADCAGLGGGAAVRAVELVDTPEPAEMPTARVAAAGYERHQLVALAIGRPRAARTVLYAMTSDTRLRQVAVHALDADALAAGAAEPWLWSYDVPACKDTVGSTYTTYLGVTRAADALYFGCRAPREGGLVSNGIHSAVTIDLGTSDPASQDPATFTSAHFPFAGDMSLGFSAGDPAGERLFLVAAGGAATNRLYVFDPRERAWTGSVPLRDDWAGSNIRHMAVDQTTGRGYVLQETHKLLVTDARLVPVPQGDEPSLGVRTDTDQARIAVDPVTRNIFVTGPRFERLDVERKTRGERFETDILVYRDTSPPLLEPEPSDPDAETHDIDETPETLVSFGGEASAYGARLLNVGGLHASPAGGGVHDASSIASRAEGPTGIGVPRPSDGDRGTFQAQISESTIGGDERGTSVVTATAVRAAVDKGTTSDLANLPAPPEQVASENEPASCSSNRDEPQAQDRTGASVRCSLESSRVDAAATTADPERFTTPVLSVRAASVSSTITRTAGVGVHIEATARTEGVVVALPGLGALHVGEIEAVATAAARGRPRGRSTYDVAMSHVVVIGPDGTEVHRCARCDPEEVAAAVNGSFPATVQASAARRDKRPSVAGSPGGARAAVMKDPYAYFSDFNVNGDDRWEVPGFQLVVHHDDRETSREIIQLAGVRTFARYTVSPPIEVDPPEPASLGIELLDDLGEPLAGGVFEVRVDPSGGVVPDPPVDDEDGDEDDDLEAAAVDGDESDGDETDGDETGGDETGGDETDGDETGGDETGGDGDELGDLGGLDPLTGELIEDGVCVTGDDGVGDCVFDGIEPGSYVVVQTTAPAGYAPALPFPVTVSPGFQTTITFTNVRSIAAIEISLTDDGDPPTPLEGGEFVVYVDDGDLALGGADVELGRCTTDAAGGCAFPEVPLESFVVHQSVAPGGLMPADDVGFTLTDPGQVAVLAFVNGAPGSDPPAAAPDAGGATTGAGGSVPPRVPSVTIQPPPPLPAPTVTQSPVDTSGGRSGPVARMLGVPGDLAGFLARSPGEALLVMSVWLLLASPVYLAARRRQLNLVKDVA